MARRNNPHTDVHPDPHPDIYEDDWEEPGTLDAPDPPPGFSYRWVRYLDPDGRPDGKRMIRAQRQGYVLVSPDELDDPAYKTLTHDGRVVVDDLALMKISDQQRERLARPIHRATQAQRDAAKHNLFREAPQSNVVGAPEYRAQSSVTRGRTAIADD